MKGNIIVKILILLVSISLAVFAVVYFIKTLVEPPVASRTGFPHVESIEATIDGMSSLEGYDFNDSLYIWAEDRLKLFTDEGFVNDDEHDDLMMQLVNRFVPTFCQVCQNKFRSRVWYAEDHARMKERIAQLDELRMISDDSHAVRASYKDSLAVISEVIRQYEKALVVAATNRFRSVAQARDLIVQAEYYSHARFLCNCEKLVEDLSQVKIHLGESHFAFLQAKLNQLKNFKQISETDYPALAESFKSAVTEYNSCKAMYGAAARSTESMLNAAGEYMEQATNYYATLNRVTVHAGGHWQSFYDSSNPTFDCYRSTGHEHNSDYRLTIEIKGRNSFEFFIKSDAEGTCDYVMVGSLGQVPSSGNCYRSTSGCQGQFVRVSYANLSTSSRYVITVIYHKDSSVSTNPDCGYVYIPKNAE